MKRSKFIALATIVMITCACSSLSPEQRQLVAHEWELQGGIMYYDNIPDYDDVSNDENDVAVFNKDKTGYFEFEDGEKDHYEYSYNHPDLTIIDDELVIECKVLILNQKELKLKQIYSNNVFAILTFKAK